MARRKSIALPDATTGAGPARPAPAPPVAPETLLQSSGTPPAAPSAVAGPLPLTKSRRSLDAKLLFLPDIRAWIEDESKRIQGVKCRRAGWTYGNAYKRVSQRLARGVTRDAMYTGLNLDMTGQYMDYCRFHAARFGMIAKAIAGEEEITYQGADGQRRKLNLKKLTLEFPSGAKIIALPSRAAALRTHGGDVDADENAHAEEQEALYEAAVSCTKWGGQFAAWSSHNGEGTEFRRREVVYDRTCAALGLAPTEGPPSLDLDTLTAKGRELRVRPIFRVHRTNIVRAVDQGLVEILNRATGAKYTRASFLQECWDECRSQEHYDQEYMCKPQSMLLAALKYKVIEDAQHKDCPAPVDGYERVEEFIATVRAHYAGGSLFVGMDIGHSQDLTVLWVWEAVGDVLWQRGILRLARCNMVDQEDAAARLFAFKMGRLSILWRGMGVGVFDHLSRKFGGRVSKIDESRAVKMGLVGGIVQAFEDHRVRIAVDDGLKEALHSVREVRTPGGQVSYDAPHSDAGHADEFWAAGAGVDGAATHETPFAHCSGGRG